MNLFRAMPSEYLNMLKIEFTTNKKLKHNPLFKQMSESINDILTKRSNIDATITELKTMSPEFIEHINAIVKSMMRFENSHIEHIENRD
ncbi:hypothetical protein [Paenibacillus periandrae]|uniref:hypothetical protein n=1 Tax=Paenibacillus periandrae TaxID=1761741 RepID=UPI001F097EDD|nr:hypothetical protein [Paenibacillus periandrae]